MISVHRPHTKGFTLMELLIVISIIGILIAVSVVSYSSAQKKGRDSRRREDLKALQNALEQYYADNAAYPGGTYPNLGTTYLPGGEPLDPKSSSTTYHYIQAIWSTSAYKICADLEGDGVWAGTNQDVCAVNLQ